MSSSLGTRAHELLDQLQPDKLAAIVHLLEVMIRDLDPVTDEDSRRYREGQRWFGERGAGIAMAEVLADFDLTLEDFPTNK